MKQKRAKAIKCWFDGACEPINPGGQMSCGCLIKSGQKVIYKTGFKLSGENYELTTNNIAEHFALYDVLQKLLELNLNKEVITIYGDSQLVIRQMQRKWKIKNGYYKSTALDNLDLLCEFSNIKFIWIPREENTKADELSKSIDK